MCGRGGRRPDEAWRDDVRGDVADCVQRSRFGGHGDDRVSEWDGGGSVGVGRLLLASVGVYVCADASVMNRPGLFQ